MGGAERIRVVCASCPWAGRRTSTDGPCPRCGAALRGARGRAPRSGEGPRVRVVVHVLPDTATKLEQERAAADAAGVGTIGSQVLDAWAKRRR